MGNICTKNVPCKKCNHYRYDEDYGDFCCFASQDTNKEEKVMVNITITEEEFRILLKLLKTYEVSGRKNWEDGEIYDALLNITEKYKKERSNYAGSSNRRSR
ncbi:MAG: hypothetical protein K6G09_08885 [Treponema sp.]|nr:hypothetical protein [Treponema sp.]